MSTNPKTFPEPTLQLRLLEDSMHEKTLQQLHLYRYADGSISHSGWVDVPVVSVYEVLKQANA